MKGEYAYRTMKNRGKSFLVTIGVNNTFWDSVSNSTWEPATFEFFDSNIDRDTLVLDIGAWIGPTALYLGQISKQCIAFEPDPIAFKELSENLTANEASEWRQQITAHNAAVTDNGQSISLGSRSAGGDSTSSALFASENTHWKVPGVKVADILAQSATEGQPIFLKIDIEGGEYSLLPSIKEILASESVKAHISLHPSFLRQFYRKKHSNRPPIIRTIAARIDYLKATFNLVQSLPFHKTVRTEKGLDIRIFLIPAAITGYFPRTVLVS